MIPNPSKEVGLLLHYEPGKKEDVIQEAYELIGDETGILVNVTGLGMSRRYKFQEFPKTNDFVPGHGHSGHMFVKFEPLA